jgi:hypothetical protein
MGTAFPLTHTRHYLTRTTIHTSPEDKSNTNHPVTTYAGTANDFPYNVYSEMVFEDIRAFEVFATRLAELEKDGRLHEDEKQFLMLEKRTVVVVDEPQVPVRLVV